MTRDEMLHRADVLEGDAAAHEQEGDTEGAAQKRGEARAWREEAGKADRGGLGDQVRRRLQDIGRPLVKQDRPLRIPRTGLLGDRG